MIDDGRLRTGNVVTATAHVVTAVIGSGVLALPWSVAQLGWILGPLVLIAFALVTYYAAILLSYCYRSPDPINGRRNYTYMDAVKASLGSRDVFMCGVLQYTNLWGTMVGYTTIGAISMMSTKRLDCYHEKGTNARCGSSGILFMIIFGAMEIVLSQIPNMEKITWLSLVAAAMSFIYSFIGLYLCIDTLVSQKELRGSLSGAMTRMMNISLPNRVWNVFQALGNIAFAYSYSMVQIEIQDTLRSPPPESTTMSRAAMYGIGITTLFYVSIGCIGYAGFGDKAPGNILNGFYEPFWLLDIANLALLVHVVGAYQVYAQPLFAFCEKWLALKYPQVRFFHKSYKLKLPFFRMRYIQFTINQLLLRTILVSFTTLVAMILPFFNSIVGLLGALAFWPLTVYYPISMYMSQAKITRNSSKWWWLQCLSMICLIVSILAGIGSVVSIIDSLKHAKLFEIEL